MKIILALLIGMTSFPLFQTDQNDELIYYPLNEGNIAFLKVDETDIYLFNTGHEVDRQQILDQLGRWNDYNIRGIIITKIDEHNCGNLTFLAKKYLIDQLILPGNSPSCTIDQKGIEVTDLSKEKSVQLTDHYQVKHYPSKQGKAGNLELKRSNFSAYWYETSSVKHNSDRATIVYIPSYIYEKDLDISFLDQLDPRVAVIQEKAKKEQMRLLNDVFSKEWIEAFFLTNKLSVHIELGNNPYRIFLVRR
ncbi:MULTISPECIES: hypothetical protein [Allobacillus]|uniref:MBL fold metallo-hydrolase n=1 Tax=Allobacillus salarius TaxID=1955272 RepID=A0A556PT30_9BACI|nr:hypothetical protein [Allobacillus salarius]TSJ67541.1 hypothetical protein FPQ13_00280 [Allobacillus salarius]